MRVPVIATKAGFDGHVLRQPGEMFEVTDDGFSPKWMKKLEPAEGAIIVVAKRGRFDGPVWRNAGAHFTIPSMSAFDADWMREANQPQKAKQD